ncbi:MAG: HD domain-containing phosphohydrolase [Anaerolineales bacterium]
MTWNINTIVPFITFFLYAGLMFVVLLSRPQTESRRRFRWFLMTMALWSLSAFFLLVDTTRSLGWMRMLASSAITMMIGLFFFVQTIIESKTSWAKYVLYYGFASVILSLFSNLVIISTVVEESTVHYVFGAGMVFISGPSYLLVIYSVILLVRSHNQTENLFERNRLLYLILAIGLIPLVSVINFFPELGKYPLDIAANGISALIIAYSILRYQLLDIRIIIRQGMVYSIPTIIIGATYFLIITLSLNIFNLYSGVEIFLLSLGVAIVTALVAEPLRVKAQQIIDRMFFREKYDSQVMLQTLSGRAASILDLYKVTNMILTEVTSTLHISKAAFFLRDEENGVFHITTHIGFEEVGNLSFRQGHPVALWLSTRDYPLDREEMEVLPQFQSLWKSERQDLERLEATLFLPIKVGSQLVGIFSLGPKRSEQAYTSEDKLTLSTVANQTAVAIENARLYTAEQNRRREIDTLYNLARQLVATDDLDTVLQSVSHYAVESVHVSYSRILIRENDKGFYCQAIYPEYNLAGSLGLGKIEPLITEHYFNWILQHGQTVVIDINDSNLNEEERQALFLHDAKTLCLTPLKGVDEIIGLLVLGEVGRNHREPFQAPDLRLVNVIADQATSAIQRAILHEQLEENFLQTVISLANAMDARDTYTSDHSQRLADMAGNVCRAMNISEEELEVVHWAAILHDIGKIRIPDEILRKKGSLTKKEWGIMKEHPETGAQIVAPVKYLSSVAPLIRAHHEKFDGSGYPYGLTGEAIPLGSRIIAVVDAYVAIRDERVYSKSHTHEEAVIELRKHAGTQFDPEVVEMFCRIITG